MSAAVVNPPTTTRPMPSVAIPTAQPAPTPILPATPAIDPGLYRFTVSQYQDMVARGILTKDDKVELLEGIVVNKMARNTPHDGTILRITKRLGRLLPPGWDIRVQSAVLLPDSKPEPDLAVVREDPDDYTTRHPTPPDIGLLIEVSESTLLQDREVKGRIYARAGIAMYWIINLVDHRVEVYSQPSGPTLAPSFAAVQTYSPGDTIPLVLDGNTIVIPVNDLLP